MSALPCTGDADSTALWMLCYCFTSFNWWSFTYPESQIFISCYFTLLHSVSMMFIKSWSLCMAFIIPS